MENGMVNMNRSQHRETNAPRDHPGRQFFSIQPNGDGTVDVILRPEVHPMKTEDGFTDYDVSVLVVKGIEPFDGLEEDVRLRYDAWCEIGEEVYL